MRSDLPDQDLANLINEAAFDFSKWLAVCEKFARFAEVEGSIIIPAHAEQRSVGLLYNCDIQKAVSDYVSDGWYLKDERERSLPVLKQRGYVTDADCIRYDEMKDSAFYNFLSNVNLRWYVGVDLQNNGNTWAFTLQRSGRSEPFSPEEIKRIVAYRNILNNSVVISAHIGMNKTLGAADAMEQHGRAVIAIDWDGGATYMSPTAYGYLGDFFQVKRGQIQACCEEDRTSLDDLVKSLCVAKNAAASTKPIRLSARSGRPPLVAYGVVLPERERDMFRSSVAMIVITDPARSKEDCADLVMQYCGVTKAEARLAVSLEAGSSVDQHALKHGISVVTARNQLQSLLHKTHTHSKAELIAKLSRIIPQK